MTTSYSDLSDRLARHLYAEGKGEYSIREAVEVAGKIAYLLSYGGPYSAPSHGGADEFTATYRENARKFAALLTLIADE